ncbi:unnamed protein product [Menidia menidia]|uniref:Cilia- and flagella-associated protein 157 n=1 Tax=Menidia menidia TaxID=238744 RepID=A0A8S4B273_9TELE|nr:unnamed protein product [Menidia menidia]
MNNKTSKTEGIPTSAFNIVSANKERDLYLTQIRYLNEELERFQLRCNDLEAKNKDLSCRYGSLEKRILVYESVFQLRCDDLEAKNKDLSCRYGSLEQEKRDVSGYLKHELSESERQVEDLRRRLNGEQKEANREQSALKMEHAREREELQARIKELMQENSDIREDLQGLSHSYSTRRIVYSQSPIEPGNLRRPQNVALRRQQAQEEELGICSPVALAGPEVTVKNESGADCLFSVEGRSSTPNSISTSSLAVTGTRSAPSCSPSAAGRAHAEGSDLLLETSYYNFYQPSRYPAYYGNLYNYQQYQMPHADARLSTHNVSSQYRMHSYYPGASYMAQGLGSAACVPPLFSLDDNTGCSEAMTACP